MSGRGRGRGGMKGGFNKVLADQLGIQKSELVKETTSCTPETFPPLQFQPVKNFERSDLDNYKLMVKKEIREHFKNSEYFITLDNKKPDIERYSDRFHWLNNKPRLHLDWSKYPKELWYEEEEKERKIRKKTGKKAKVNLKSARSSVKVTDTIDIDEKLSKIKEKDEDEDEEKMEEENEGSVVDEEEDPDQDMDDGTDYMKSHFDNGESFGDDDEDDNLEAAVCF
ncbi:UNVERIFIED_CONTAM: hypothetical protein RMT77_006812 [Armadillidium vulgare]